jgi:hypothetical protein
MLGGIKEMLMKPYWILGLLVLGLASCGGQDFQTSRTLGLLPS